MPRWNRRRPILPPALEPRPATDDHGVMRCLLRILALVALVLASAGCGQPSPTPSAASVLPTASATAATGPSTTPAPTPTPGPSPTPAGVSPGSVDRTSIALVATYDVAATIHYGDGAVSLDETIEVRNASGGPIDRLELNTVTARVGALRLGAVTVEGAPSAARVADQTIVVPLGGILADGAAVTVRLSLAATLRADLAGSNWLFTRTNGVISAYRWIPWISLARPFDRPNYGDPFFTASSPNVRVAITTDRPLVIAATGRQVAASGLTQVFEAANVRDFVLSASPSYTVTSRKAGSVTVEVYALAGYPTATIMGYATDAIAREGTLAGAYPYATFRVAQSAGGFGMEGPQTIWIPGGLSGRQLHWLVYHETAHQWFYGIVGSDQANQPFADEAAADHLARTASELWRSSTCAIARLDLSIYRYSSACYFEDIYVQGSLLLDQARKAMGTDAYWQAIRDYVATYRFGIGSTRSLLTALQARTSVDLAPILAPRFPSLY